MTTALVESFDASRQKEERSLVRPASRELQAYIVDNPETGAFTVARALFSDPELFALEMQYIFEGTWIYVAHESQLPRPHDFYTVTIGRQPVVLMRNHAGELGGFLNVCPHRGATVCVRKRGNQKILTCPYHGWAFNSSGALVSIKDAATGAYPESFERADHNLPRIPRLASYRGFLFASLNPDVPDLETHLGEARRFIDLLVDQAPQGLEVVRGSSDYTYAGNWKLQVENGVDGYHFDVVHRTFLGVVQRRARSGQDSVKAVDATRLDKMQNGLYDLGNGHTLLWTDYPNPQDRPGYERRAELAARYGDLYARWMTDRLRNLLIYPNVFFMDQTSTQIRVVHPLAVDKTKVSTYCIAPVGESPEARAHRLRQYEDFFNASGVGTPDDLAAFEACQRGYQGTLARWQQGYERGVRRMIRGGDAEAQALGVHPCSTSNDFRDETIYHGQYRQWLRLMLAGQQTERRRSDGC
ncbi:MAG: aromatic ring-hydroxylating dioxygenase subunit alpha [Bacillota bacterium]|jgi:benzoate/toluate 1,2-dioxygenase alpha subunit